MPPATAGASLYRAAVRQRELHHKIIGDHSRPETERNHSRRLRAQAESQIRLLTEAEGIYEGDFYSYRYFAAEGFLPGYNFPRLPLSAYVPGRRKGKGRDEFVSRPRFLAISEFGPRALIYHEGARYRVYKVNLDFGSDDIEATHTLVTSTMKRCVRCGYAHLEQGTNLAEVCDRCGAALDGPAIDRKSGPAAERQPQARSAHHLRRGRTAAVRLQARHVLPLSGDRRQARPQGCRGLLWTVPLAMRLSYGDATDLYRINLGWANQRGNQPPGFNLDLERGYWARNQADDEDQDDATARPARRVVPYVKDTKNALVMRFEPPATDAEMASLQAAFKEAIQKHFQLEPRELSCEPMPSANRPAGDPVLRSVGRRRRCAAADRRGPHGHPALARRALEICHFDPDTLEDTKRCDLRQGVLRMPARLRQPAGSPGSWIDT